MKWPRRRRSDRRDRGAEIDADTSAAVPAHRDSPSAEPRSAAPRSVGSVTVSDTGPAFATAPNATAISGHIEELTLVGRLPRLEPRPWPHRVGHVPPRAQSHLHRVQADRLRRVVAGDGAALMTQAVLTGTGGVGKTQIAADHARTAWDAGELDALVWITANNRDSIVNGLAQAGVELCRADPEDAGQAAAAFLAWLAPAPSSTPPASASAPIPASAPAPAPAPAPRCRWMIVLDDVADPHDMRGLWPPASPCGRTLITTRRRDAALAGTTAASSTSARTITQKPCAISPTCSPRTAAANPSRS